MTTSPVKRYRSRSRLHTADRAGLREKALDLAQKGLTQKRAVEGYDKNLRKGLANRRGGPVDKGSPAEQKQAADQLENERAEQLARQQNEKQQAAGSQPQSRQAQSFSGLQLHKNTTGNARSGGLFRTKQAEGGVIHDYNDGRRVFVRKPAASRETGPTSGTYNHSLKPSGGSVAQGTLEKLAAQRATQNRPKSRRKLFTRA